MKLLEKILRKEIKFKLSDITPANIWAVFSGYYRYHLHYLFPSLYAILVRKHIREQIEYRINSSLKECIQQGYCKHCGCSVTALQHASKPCGGFCYPKMLSYYEWYYSKRYPETTIQRHGINWYIDHKKKKFFEEYKVDIDEVGKVAGKSHKY